MDIEEKILELSETYAFRYADFVLEALHESELEHDTMVRLLGGITEDVMNELLIFLIARKKL